MVNGGDPPQHPRLDVGGGEAYTLSMRTVVLASIVLLAGAATSHADTDVKLHGGLVSIHANNAPLPEILERLQEKTGMKVIYDGTRPYQLVAVTIEDQTLVAALTSLLESQGVKFAIALNAAGTQVDTLLISTSSTSPSPPGAVAAPVESFPNEEGGYNPPMPFEPPPSTMPAGSEPVAQPPVAFAAVPVPPVASPFTPQGPGPIIIPPPSPGAGATPPPQTPPAVMTPLPGPSTAERAPWEK
jgi:hypothetical protein